MKSTYRRISTTLVAAAALALGLSASAQQSTQAIASRLQSYDINREVSLVGTVAKFDPAFATPPIGAHLLVQTVSGQIDVHLGNAKVLEANHLTLNPGDSVRIVGEYLALGNLNVFAARIVQKGAQAVAVRNLKGFVIGPSAPLSASQMKALRGVR